MTDAYRHLWQPWEGRTVDGIFVLARFLGGTGRAGVYLTEYDGLPAAIKLVPCDPAAAGELLAPWEIASQWSHPNVLKIFAAGHSLLDKIYVAYIVMELAEDDLSHVLSERKLTEQETRDTVRPVLAALAYLHQQGFVHGRVKPSNVMAAGPAGQDIVKLSTDRAARGGDPATDLRDLAALIGEMLPSPLPAPFSEIARHCLNPDPLERWTIPMLETRLAAKSVWAARAASAGSSQAAPSIPSLPQTSPSAASLPKAFAPDESAEKSAQLVESAREYLARKAVAQKSNPRKSTSRKFMWTGAAVAALVAAVLIATLAIRLGRTAGDSQVPVPAANPSSNPAANRAATSSPTPPQAPPVSAKAALPRAAKELPPAPEQSPRDRAASAGAAPAANTAVVTRVLPEFSKLARDSIHGRVRINVRLEVDVKGNVTGASLDPPAASRYFSERTLAASRRWKFRPNSSARAWVLHYEIFSDDLRVTPTPVK